MSNRSGKHWPMFTVTSEMDIKYQSKLWPLSPWLCMFTTSEGVLQFWKANKTSTKGVENFLSYNTLICDGKV